MKVVFSVAKSWVRVRRDPDSCRRRGGGPLTLCRNQKLSECIERSDWDRSLREVIDDDELSHQRSYRALGPGFQVRRLNRIIFRKRVAGALDLAQGSTASLTHRNIGEVPAPITQSGCPNENSSGCIMLEWWCSQLGLRRDTDENKRKKFHAPLNMFRFSSDLKKQRLKSARQISTYHV
ncbi:hypothetical protein CEXT_339321 [Caerostris extrusa]|uniref:Uncharacterized protein n=1 Tax=Caerostris extrusa TaxID=172846 RepID=A0AAV4TTJ7_CAEEX|nr:hypothetical protein CEXT_339321 [Caerostris extrusa]